MPADTPVPPVRPLSDSGKSHPRDLPVQVHGIQVGHTGYKIYNRLNISVKAPSFPLDDKLFGYQLQQLLRLGITGTQDSSKEFLQHPSDDIVARYLYLHHAPVVIYMLYRIFI